MDIRWLQQCTYLIILIFILQSLVEKHFPAPDRDKINRILGINKPKSILDELGIKLPDKNGSSKDNDSTSAINGGKRSRRAAAENVRKKMKTDWDALGSSSEDEDKVRNESYQNLYLKASKQPYFIYFSIINIGKVKNFT